MSSLVVLPGLLLAGAVAATEMVLLTVPAPPGGVAVLSIQLTEAGDDPVALVLELQLDMSGLALLEVTPGNAVGDATLDYVADEEGLRLVVFGGTMAFSEGQVATVYLGVHDSVSAGTEIGITTGRVSAANAAAEGLAIGSDISTVLSVQALGRRHDADTDGDSRIELSEVLREVQLFRLGALYCDGETEDGYSSAPGDRECTPHSLDYAPQDWRIDLSELLRCIQFYNGHYRMYHVDSAGEDGFAPGPAGFEPVD